MSAYAPHRDFVAWFDARQLARVARGRTPPAAELQPELAAIHDRALVIAGEDLDRYDLRRRTWISYLGAANSIGLLERPGFLERLRSSDDDLFRGALAECMVAYYLATLLGYEVTPGATGRAGADPDFSVRGNDVSFVAEVKAPAVARVSTVQYGMDARVLRNAVARAGSQMATNGPQVVAIAPVLRTPVHHHPSQLVEAVIGAEAWVAPFDTVREEIVGEILPAFQQTGKLARIHTRRATGEEGTDLTRVSAVLVLEEAFIRRTHVAGDLEIVAVIVHNPFAAHPIAPSVFPGASQFVREGDEMRWIGPSPVRV